MNEKELSDLFPVWLKYLLDVCRPRWRENGLGAENPKAIALMDSFYSDNQDAVMAGVKAYLSQKTNAFIPFPGEIRQYMATTSTVKTRVSFSVARRAWPICPICEEHTPDLDNCPVCADMKAAQSYNQQINHQLLAVAS